MQMASRRKIDSWSTDNCCVRWSLRTGTLFIASTSIVCLGLLTALFSWVTYECWGIYLQNCTLIPEPERNIVNATTSDDYKFDVDIVLSLLTVYFTIYFIMSILVIIGTLKQIPKLLQGWVYCTRFLMVLIVTDLVITLAFTTLSHLIFCFVVFVVSLYTWAVVRSHMNAINLAQYAVPLPENAVKEYTVDGLNLDALAVEVKV